MRVNVLRSMTAVAMGSVMLGGARPIARATPIRATVNSLEYLGTTYSSSDRVPIFRGVSADITVRGQFVDLSTGVEVRTTSGAVANDLGASIIERVGGNPARIKVHLTSGGTSTLRAYRILIHYTVEVNGPDQFEVTLFERGTVNTLSITSPAEQLFNGGYLAGSQLELRAEGTGLSRAAIATNSTSLSGITVGPGTTVGTPTDATAFFGIKFDSSGFKRFQAGRSFYDGTLGPPPDEGGCIVAICYGGAGTVLVLIRILPNVTSASPSSAAPNANITLTGTRLQPRGYTPKVRFLKKYRPNNQSADVAVVAANSGSGLQFAAPGGVRPDSIRLAFEDPSSPRDSLASTSVPVPSISITTTGSPVIQRLDSLGPSGNKRAFIKAGQQVLRGQNLAVPSLNGVAFQAQLGIVSAGYRANSPLVQGQTGADSIVFTVPFPHSSFADTVLRQLTVQTQFGTATANDVLFVPPPLVTEIQTFASGGNIETTIPLSGGSLVKGKKYRVKGRALLLSATSGVFREMAQMQLNGGSLVVSQSTTGFTTAETDAVFQVPLNTTSGMLTVTTSGGTVSVGPFTVIDPPVALDLVGVSLSPTTVAGGQTITATVAINGTVPAGGNAGNIVFSSPTVDGPVVLPAGLVPVTSNPLVVSIPTRPVASVQNLTIRVSTDPTANQSDHVTASLSLRPPAPTSVTVTPASLVGGRTIRGVVRLNTSVPAAAGLSIGLTSSDPTTIAVPSSVAISGDSAVFTVTTAVVPADRQVTITATSGGESRSATATVLTTVLSGIQAFPDSIIPGVSNATVQLSFSGALAAPATATVTCDPALICPATVSVPSGQVKPEFTVQSRDVPSKIEVPVDVTVNGVTKRDVIRLKPLAIRTLTMSPDTVHAGVQSSVTIQLNAALPNGRTATVSFSSSDPSVVPAPGQAFFAAGEITKLKTITTIAPQSGTRVVTLTATFTQNLSGGGVNTSNETVRITVIP